MTDFKFQGTGSTTGGGDASGVVLLLALAFAVSAVAAAIVAALMAIALAVLVLAVVVGGVSVAFLFYRRRHPEIVTRLVRPPVIHQLAPEPERPAIAPREVHHHNHNHLHIAPGTDLSGLGDLFGKETITEGNQ